MSTTAPRWAEMHTPAKTACIAEFVQRGMGTPEIARKLGCTRSSILSHARRYKVRLERRAPTRATPMEILPPVPASAWEAHRSPIGLLEITDDTCRWPVGVPEGAKQLFCGDQSHKRGHCERHWRIRCRTGHADRI